MLTELRIQNFAIIEQLELHLKPGLLIFTGETGAGKSIIFDAIDTLLGGRADSDMIRSGADRALIEGTFSIPDTLNLQVNAILEREDLLDEPGILMMSRELRSNGRTTARINGRPVTVGLLKELGEFLVDLHGQSEHLSLLRVREHLGLLDRYSETSHLLEAYKKVYHQLQTTRRQIAELSQAERDAIRRKELLQYQVEEIKSAHLQPNEEVELQTERDRLANAEEITSLAQEALRALDEGSIEAPAVTDLFGQAIYALGKLSRLDASQVAMYDLAQNIVENISDLVRRLRHYLENIEYDPKRLDRLEERLALIFNLKRKYGETIPAILAFGEKARQDLDNITHAQEKIKELEDVEHKLLEDLAGKGLALSEARQHAAEVLSQSVQNELNDLHMTGARFEVNFSLVPDPKGIPLPDGQRVSFDESGFDKVEFLIAPNPGEGLKPLVKIASGGETSRLMLALKNVLVQADPVPTLIFDEIDQGIGGRVGAIVGQKLWKLARQHQVLCITHLPQLAAYGDQHYNVRKVIQDGRTITQVTALEGENRLIELAQMMGEVSEGTLRSAFEILESAHALTASCDEQKNLFDTTHPITKT